MHKSRFAIVAALAAVALAGCSGRKDVSFSTLEDARAQGKANAEFNAANYRAENPRLTGTKIVAHGDSTQTADCPQGDGWASVSFMSVNQQTGEVYKVKAKCSTVSANNGCWLDSDFEKKPFANQENRCDASLPHPMPKLGK